VNEQQKDFRAKRFFSSVLQTLPISFLLSYILMLDLQGRVSDAALWFALTLSFLSFAIGTSQFIGGNEDRFMGIVVFVQVFFQFLFRIFVICAVCARFMQWGLLAVTFSWLVVYIFGPQGCLRTLHSMLKPGTNVCTVIAKLLIKIFLTPLTFALVVAAVYEIPGPLLPNGERAPGRPVMAYDCFYDTPFLLWRLFENCVLALCFVIIPVEDAERGAGDYEPWLDYPAVTGVISFLSVFMILSTWMIIVNSRPRQTVRTISTEMVRTTGTLRNLQYQPQVDLA
jgi:hypothetical protein